MRSENVWSRCRPPLRVRDHPMLRWCGWWQMSLFRNPPRSRPLKVGFQPSFPPSRWLCPKPCVFSDTLATRGGVHPVQADHPDRLVVGVGRVVMLEVPPARSAWDRQESHPGQSGRSCLSLDIHAQDSRTPAIPGASDHPNAATRPRMDALPEFGSLSILRQTSLRHGELNSFHRT